MVIEGLKLRWQDQAKPLITKRKITFEPVFKATRQTNPARELAAARASGKVRAAGRKPGRISTEYRQSGLPAATEPVGSNPRRGGHCIPIKMVRTMSAPFPASRGNADGQHTERWPGQEQTARQSSPGETRPGKRAKGYIRRRGGIARTLRKQAGHGEIRHPARMAWPCGAVHPAGGHPPALNQQAERASALKSAARPCGVKTARVAASKRG